MRDRDEPRESRPGAPRPASARTSQVALICRRLSPSLDTDCRGITARGKYPRAFLSCCNTALCAATVTTLALTLRRPPGALLCPMQRCPARETPRCCGPSRRRVHAVTACMCVCVHVIAPVTRASVHPCIKMYLIGRRGTFSCPEAITIELGI